MKKLYGMLAILAVLVGLSSYSVQGVTHRDDAEFSLIGVNDGSEHEADEAEMDEFYALTAD